MSPSLAWAVLILDSADAETWGLFVVSLCIAFALGWAFSCTASTGSKEKSISSKLIRGEDRYEGERDKEGRRSGKGTMFYANGATYEGDWYKDKPWGRGKARSVNGDVYDGEWMDGKRANKGECLYADGSCFIGNFRDGKKHGRGVLTFKSLESFQGYWEEGELVEAVMRSQSYIYEGQVRALKPDGEGHMIFLLTERTSDKGNEHKDKNGSVSSPSSPRRGDVLIGLARGSSTQGDEYRGGWRDGLMHGNGVYHFHENDSYYEGQFEDNLLHGRGRLSVVHASSEVDHEDAVERPHGERLVSSFEGEFIEGIPAAQGVYCSWLGSVYEGELTLLFKEPDGSFSPHKNKEAANRVFMSKEKIASLASSAKKLFMRVPGEEDEEDDGDHEDENEVSLTSEAVFQRADTDKEGVTPQLTREQRLYARKVRGKASSFSVVWDDKLAFMHAHGSGRMLYPNGDKYTGEFRRNLRHGQGKLEYADKRDGVYEGGFEDDLPHGQGKLQVHVEGQGEKVYDGEFALGLRSGMGKLCFASGATYEGQWASDAFWGTGRYRFANGDVYSGAFEAGKRTGVGRMEYANGSVFQGRWHNNLRVQGQHIYQNGNTYTGEYRHNAMEGVGRFVWADGSSYEGCWVADKAEGMGRFAKPGKAGYVYEGGWKANKKHTGEEGDIARVVYNNGDEFQGQFQRGKMTGKGTLTTRDGVVQKGDFFDGVFQG